MSRELFLQMLVWVAIAAGSGFAGGAVAIKFLHTPEAGTSQPSAIKADQETIVTRNLSIVDKNGNKRLTFESSAEGEPGIIFYDNNQAVRGLVGLSADGQPGIHFFDESGQVAWFAR